MNIEDIKKRTFAQREKEQGKVNAAKMVTVPSLTDIPNAMLFPCEHRGLSTGERKPCESGCAKGKQVPLQHCSLHGKCSVSLPLNGVVCCRTCPDRKAPAPVLVEKNVKPTLVGPSIPYREVVVPEPPPLEGISPKSPVALVTVAFGETGQKLLDVTGPYMEAYAKKYSMDFLVLNWPGHPDWPISGKFQIARALDHYERSVYVDADVLLRPGCINLLTSCAPDEFGFCDELPFHRGQPQHGRELDYLRYRHKMKFPLVKHLPFMFNAGVMVVPKAYKDFLLPPKRPTPVGHCYEQDHTNSQVLDAYLAGKCKIRMMDRRCNWQNWTDYGFHSAPLDAVLHWSGGGEDRKTRHESIREYASFFPLAALSP